MERRAIVKDGVVINVISYDPSAKWDPPEGCELGPEGGEIGMLWDGKQYSPDPDPNKMFRELKARRAALMDKIRSRNAKRHAEALAKLTPQERLARAGLTLEDLKLLTAEANKI